jgi:subtilisin family serine protease
MIAAIIIAVLSITTAVVHKTTPIEHRSQLIQNWPLKDALQVEEAWNSGKGDPSVIVAVMDTGINSENPDLKDHLWKDPANPATFGKDFITNKENPSDVQGHGTAMSGIIAGGYNEEYQTSGIAPNVKIMSLRVIPENKEITEELKSKIGIINANAIRFAIKNHARVINMSFYGEGSSQEEFTALKEAEASGVLIVVSAGNKNHSLDDETPEKKTYPANYQLSNMIVVGGTNRKNEKIDASNFGSVVDVSAPGISVLAPSLKNDYRKLYGTSPSTAMVSGIAALLFSQDSKLTATEVKAIILSSVIKVDNLASDNKTSGVVNAKLAIDQLHVLEIKKLEDAQPESMKTIASK